MAKIKVHELAKELDKPSKDVIAALESKGVEGKKAASGLEDNEVDIVKKAFDSDNKVKADESGEAPKKKKNIIFVSNPYNSKMPGQPSRPTYNNTNNNNDRRPANNQPQARPVGGEQKPATVSPAIKAEDVARALNQAIYGKTEQPQEVKKEAVTPIQETVKPTPVVSEVQEVASKPAEAVNETATASVEKTIDHSEKPVEQKVSASVDRPQGQGTYNQTDRPQGQRTYNQGDRPQGQRTYNQGDRPQGQGTYNQGDRPQGQRTYNQGDRPQGQGTYNQGDRPQGQRTYNQGDRPQGQGSYNQGSTQGQRPYTPGGYQGQRPYTPGGAQGQQRPYTPGGAQGQQRPYTPGGAQGQQRPYTPGGFQGQRPYTPGGAQGQQRPYTPGGAQGQQRPYTPGGYQGQRPYTPGGAPGQRPYTPGGAQGQRTYNQGDRPQGGYNNNYNGQDKDRPYNNDRSRGPGGDNKYGKPQGAKPFSGDTPNIQPDKRRDEVKRKLGQEKDNRSRKDKIYEDDQLQQAGKNKAGKFIKPEKKIELLEEIKVIIVPEIITIKELAEKMRLQPSVIVKKLFLKGQIVTVNQEITYEAAEEIAIEYDIMCEPEVKIDVIEELLKEEKEDEAEMTARPPVICVMGHVDHGKTSLLDAIRKTNVTDREAGGITQHIGAYTVTIKNQKITFLDTPGHEAFTSMRMRGANSTDIAVLVVAADDGVMPQTVEAISHAKAAGIEVIVAINKMDKPNANIDRVKQELSEHGLIPEEWGGSTVFAPVSARTGDGIEQLLEMILLTADILELKANTERSGRGLVIEAQLDKGRGPVATVLVQKGTLHVGDFIAAGACHGKVRAMIDDKGRRVKEAGPSTPVEILGLNDVPNAGEIFVSPSNDKEATQFADTFISQHREKMIEDTKAKMSLDDLFTQIKAGNLKELDLIVKADVQGSVEAVKQSLLKLSNEEVVVKIIHGGVGSINESDVILASASQAIIIGFNVRPDAMAKATAEREGVDVRLYKVIYQAIEDVEAAMKGMLDPIFEEKVIGHAEVRQIFKASAVGNIAGSYVLDGTFKRGCKVRINRAGEVVFDGELDSLKRFKDDVKEVKAGFECGLVFDGFDQMQELDIVEAYMMVEVPRS